MFDVGIYAIREMQRSYRLYLLQYLLKFSIESYLIGSAAYQSEKF